jgi:hypothetical protein
MVRSRRSESAEVLGFRSQRSGVSGQESVFILEGSAQALPFLVRRIIAEFHL